jgi:hypothetical protein
MLSQVEENVWDKIQALLIVTATGEEKRIRAIYLLNNMSYWSRVGKQTFCLNKPTLRCNIRLQDKQEIGERSRTYLSSWDDLGTNVSRPFNGFRSFICKWQCLNPRNKRYNFWNFSFSATDEGGRSVRFTTGKIPWCGWVTQQVSTL